MKLKRTIIGFLTATMLATAIAVPAAPQKAQAAAKKAYADSTLIMRTLPKKSSKKVKKLRIGKEVNVLSYSGKWAMVKVGKKIGFVRKKGLTYVSGEAKGKQVVAYALRFVGNPYRWGGTSLTHGADCSGYVMSVYRHFGKSLPHSSAADRHVGTAVHGLKNARPGDLICYSGHVALYMGKGRIVHASNPSTGIKISANANYRHIVAIRRIFK